MTTHTPGPWRTKGTVKHSNMNGFEAVVDSLYGPGLCTIAKAYSGNGQRNDENTCLANAALIAAAPDLLEALKDAFRFVVTAHGDDDESSPETKLLIDKIDAAIAKAEGRTEQVGA